MKTAVLAAMALIASLLTPAPAKNLDDAMSVVDRYVSEHKHWKKTDYTIHRRGEQGRYIVFLVNYLLDEQRITAGGSKTFEAYYDPAQRKVVKEVHFQ